MSFRISNLYILVLLSLISGIVSVVGDSEEDSVTETSDVQKGTTMKTIKEEMKELEKVYKEEEKMLESVSGKESVEDMEKTVTEAAAILTKEKEILKEAETELEKEKGKEENIGEEANIEAEEEIVHEAGVMVSEAEEALQEITIIPKVEVSEESLTSASPVLGTVTSFEKDEAPKDTYAVWNSKGKICLLAKFRARFSILYHSKGGEQQFEINLPQNGNVKGKCESSSRSPLLQISWQKFTFTMMFNKSDEENWVVTSIELTYDTSEHLFDRATNAGKKTARSKALSLFEAPIGKSSYCPAQEVVLLYSANKQVVTAKLEEVFLQPYAVEEAKFSSAHRCNKVVIDGPDETFIQDETIPLAVGCTLALITLIILVGFSVHRAYNAAKVDYNTME